MVRTVSAAALCLVLASLIGGEVGPVLASALGAEDHVCACPIDADGHCQCVDCIRLDIHGDRDERRDDEKRAPRGPLWTSSCGPGSALPALVTLDPWNVVPPVIEPSPPHADLRPLPGPARPPIDPDLPRLERPPRLG